MPDKM